jgi:hypothetical protein
VQKQSSDIDPATAAQVGADKSQANLWALKK